MDDVKLSERERRDAEVEARAAEAYEALHDHKSDRNDWAHWMRVADGLAIGRRWAMAKAGCQDPVGKGYNTAFSKWMADRPWASGLDKPTRSHLFWCLDNRSDIEEWRDTLDAKERVRKNHPTHMRRAYLKAHPDEDKDKDKDENEDDRPPKKTKVDEQVLREENATLRTTVQKLRQNPFPWWDGAAGDGARSMFEDRGDGRRGDGKARALLIALAEEFATRLPNQVAQLLDELMAIMRPTEHGVVSKRPRRAAKAAETGKEPGKRPPRAARAKTVNPRDEVPVGEVDA
jgi:hypothetical protein